MNQKEYNLIGSVIRGRKENAAQSYHFGYSQKEIEGMLLVIQDLEDHMASELHRTYDSFDLAKFREA